MVLCFCKKYTIISYSNRQVFNISLQKYPTYYQSIVRPITINYTLDNYYYQSNGNNSCQTFGNLLSQSWRDSIAHHPVPIANV